MLPGVSGCQICTRMRAHSDTTPVLMLTARDGEYDEAEGLDSGADDYLTKPFSFVVLAARIRALARRARTPDLAPPSGRADGGDQRGPEGGPGLCGVRAGPGADSCSAVLPPARPERFGRNHGEDINVVDDMKIKRLIAEQIGPKATASPSSPGAASSSPDAAPPPSSPPSSPAPADGGGIPCVD